MHMGGSGIGNEDVRTMDGEACMRAEAHQGDHIGLAGLE